MQAHCSNSHCLNGGVSLQQCGNSLRKRPGGPEHTEKAGSEGVTCVCESRGWGGLC